MRATAGETEEPAAEGTDHHENTRLSRSHVEAMMIMKGMLHEREVEDKDCKVRIQSTGAEVEFTSEGVR